MLRAGSFFCVVLASTLTAFAQTGAPERPAVAVVQPIRAVALGSDEAIRLDGRLDEAVWQRAPVYREFHEIDPVRGRKPDYETRVQVAYGERALYVAVIALDPRPEQIRQPLVRHDLVNRTQDFVVVYIDPVGGRKAAQFFRANAAGSTADGIHTADNDNESFAPDYDFDVVTAPWQHEGERGWVAEFRIPYSSLRYTADPSARWRIQIGRRIPREQFTLVLSTPLARGALSFIDAMQPLEGFKPPQDHAFLNVRPTLTVRRTEDEPVGGPTRRDGEIKPSLDVKWRLRPELVVDATVNPDFSQVELDIPQLSRNTRFALFLSEKRPFFLESGDLLASPTDALYTRSVNDPRWGLRASWRSDRLAGTALLARDKGGGLTLLPGAYGTGAALQPANTTLMSRARSDVGDLTVGAIAIDRRYADGRGENAVLGADGTWSITPNWRIKAQWMGSRTTALADGSGELSASRAETGSKLYASLYGRTERTETGLTIQRTSADFRNDAGFVAQSGVRKIDANQNYEWQRIGPFNKVSVFVNAGRTEALDSGEMVSQYWFPGVYLTAARNTEINFEYDPASKQRTAPGAPVLTERFAHLWAMTTPARWMPLLEGSIDAGDLADVTANRIRPGLRWYLYTRLRPAPRVELEPRVDQLVLRQDGERVYTETAARLLSIVHVAPRQSLRLILQRTSFERRAEPALNILADRSRSSAQSLTYAWRRSAGTVLYVGAGRGAVGLPLQKSRGSEVFLKLQADMDEAREAWRARRAG
jgi:hypothetical protein